VHIVQESAFYSHVENTYNPVYNYINTTGATSGA